MNAFTHWLSERGLPKETIKLLVTLAGDAEFESPDRIMSSDKWFHFPENRRFIMVGSCPNGDGIGLDTIDKPGAVYFIDHERIGFGLPESEITVCVAGSLQEYVRRVIDEPDFPYDYYAAKRMA